jgi:hypothetical protein
MSLSGKRLGAQLTLWGAMAEKPGQELEAAVAGGARPVLAVKVQSKTVASACPHPHETHHLICFFVSCGLRPDGAISSR